MSMPNFCLWLRDENGSFDRFFDSDSLDDVYSKLDSINADWRTDETFEYIVEDNFAPELVEYRNHDADDADDGQPSEYQEWQDYMGGDDWDHGQYDSEY
jgi:hypothetical protein